MMKNLEKFSYNTGDVIKTKDGDYLITDRKITMQNIGMYELQDPTDKKHRFWQAAQITEAMAK